MCPALLCLWKCHCKTLPVFHVCLGKVSLDPFWGPVMDGLVSAAAPSVTAQTASGVKSQQAQAEMDVSAELGTLGHSFSGKQNKGFGLLAWLWLQLSESLPRTQFCRSWNSGGCNQNDAHLRSVKPWTIWVFCGGFFVFLMFREKGSLLRNVWASLQLTCWSLQHCWNLLMSNYYWTHREYHRAHFVWVFLIWIFNVLH